MYSVTKQFRFEAAHSLPHLPEGHKCRHLHGHSYRVTVTCSGELHENGMVVDYAYISAAMCPVIGELDHRNINEVLPVYTTAENIAKWIFDRLLPLLPCVSAVTVCETESTSATYGRIG